MRRNDNPKHLRQLGDHCNIWTRQVSIRGRGTTLGYLLAAEGKVFNSSPSSGEIVVNLGDLDCLLLA